MLKHIASVYGGQVNIITVAAGPGPTKKKKPFSNIPLEMQQKDKITGAQFVQWTINDRNKIRNNILPLFTSFPPLTTRVTLQLSFVFKALAGMTMDDYFAIRADKYITRPTITPLFNVIPPYFAS